jgi:hypothetical protein
MNPEDAARTLRNLVHDHGDTNTFDAFEFILDELRAARGRADHIQKMLDRLRREYAQLVSDNMRDQSRRNQAQMRAIAETLRVPVNSLIPDTDTSPKDIHILLDKQKVVNTDGKEVDLNQEDKEYVLKLLRRQ